MEHKGLDGEEQHSAFNIHMLGLKKSPCGLDLSWLCFGKELCDREFKSVDIDQHVHRALPDLETSDSLAFSTIIHGRLLSRCDFRGKDFGALHDLKEVGSVARSTRPTEGTTKPLSSFPESVSALHFA